MKSSGKILGLVLFSILVLGLQNIPSVSAVQGDLGSVTDTLEFDIANGITPQIIQINGDVFAVVWVGTGGDGNIATFTVDNVGAVSDNLVNAPVIFDNTIGNPKLFHITDDKYGILFEDGASLNVRTYTINNAGTTITAVTASTQVVVTGADPSIVKLSGAASATQFYGIAYQGAASEGFVDTISIDADGTGITSAIDNSSFNNEANDAEILKVGTTDQKYAIAYRDNSDIGKVEIMDILDNGTVIIDDAVILGGGGLNGGAAISSSSNLAFIHVTGQIYAVFYSDGADGIVETLTIPDNGSSITSITTSGAFDPAGVPSDPFVIQTDTGVDPINFVIAYQNTSSNTGELRTVTISVNGNTILNKDNIQFDTSSGETPFMVHRTGEFYVIAYEGPSNDGFVSAFKLGEPIDATAPFVTSATIISSGINNNILQIVFNEDIIADTIAPVFDDFGDLTLFQSGGTRNITSIVESPAGTLTVTFDGAAIPTNETATLVINSTILDTSSNPFVSTTQSIADGLAPTAVATFTQSAFNNNKLTIVYSEPVSTTLAHYKSLVLDKAGTTPNITSAATGTNPVIVLTFDGPAISTDETSTAKFVIDGVAVVDLANTPNAFGTGDINFSVGDGLRPLVDTAEWNLGVFDGNIVRLSFSENISPVPSPNAFSQVRLNDATLRNVTQVTQPVSGVLALKVDGNEIPIESETGQIVQILSDSINDGSDNFVTGTSNFSINSHLEPQVISAKVTSGNVVTVEWNKPMIAKSSDYGSIQITGTTIRAVDILIGASGSGTSTILVPFTGDPVTVPSPGFIDIGFGALTDPLDLVKQPLSPVLDDFALTSGPVIDTALITGGNTITITFFGLINTATTPPFDFSDLIINQNDPRTIDSVSSSGNTVTITFSGDPINSDATATIDIATTLTDGSGISFIGVNDLELTNALVPILTTVSIVSDNVSPTVGEIGDTVTLSFTASEPILDPVVTINENSIVSVNTVDNTWQATRIIDETDPQGIIAFTIDFQNLNNDVGLQVTSTTDGTIVTIDTVAPNPPVITIPVDGLTLFTDIITISGTSEPDSIVEIFEGQLSLGTETTNTNGTWSFLTSSLFEGSHTFTATAADSVGNVSDLSGAVTITIDTTVELSDRSYNNDLLSVYNSRSDLQEFFPEAAGGDFARLYGWAVLFGVHESTALLGQHESMYSLLWVYHAFRPDLQTTYPEAAFGADITGLLEWAALSGVNEHANILADDEVVTEILWIIQKFRPDLAVAFSEALNGNDLSNVWQWAALNGITEHSNILADDEAVIVLMWVYEEFRPDLQSEYPEANNAGILDGLFDWAANFGVNEHANILAEHAAEYAAGPP